MALQQDGTMEDLVWNKFLSSDISLSLSLSILTDQNVIFLVLLPETWDFFVPAFWYSFDSRLPTWTIFFCISWPAAA